MGTRCVAVGEKIGISFDGGEPIAVVCTMGHVINDASPDDFLKAIATELRADATRAITRAKSYADQLGIDVSFEEILGKPDKSAAQSPKMSAIEAASHSAIGFTISVILTMVVYPWLFGAPAALGASVASVMIFTVVSILRSYIVRRAFTWLHHVKGIN